MSNPSFDAIVAIRARVTNWSQSIDSVVAFLNAPDAAFSNPSPQGQVAAVISESALLSLLTDPNNGSIVKLNNWVNFSLLKSDIEGQNRIGIGLWCQILPLLGLITQGEATAIINYIQSTEPDPTWSPTISWAQATLGRPVDFFDVAAARPSGV